MKKKHQDYTEEELRQERQYGLFWYSWLWHLLRPLLIALCVVLVVAGVVMTGYNWIDRHFFAPMDAQDQTPVSFTVASGSSLGFTSKVVMELMRQLPSVLSRVKRYLMGVQAGGEAGRPSAAALEVPVMERTSSTTSTDRVPSQGHTRIRLNERV